MKKNNRSSDIHINTSKASKQNSWAARLGYFDETAWWSEGHRPVRDQLVQALDESVTASGALESVYRWRHEDNPRSANARTVISDRAILVGFLVLSAERSPLRITDLADLFEHRLSSDSRRRLGLPEDLGAGLSPASRSTRWVASIGRAFHRLLDVMDPLPQPTFRRMSFADIANVVDSHDADRQNTRKARLDEFTQLFLDMTFAAQPAVFTDPKRRIDITIVDRFVPSGSKNGFNRRSLAAKALDESFASAHPDKRVVDIFAGWYPGRTSRHANDTLPPRKVEMHWGRTATMAVRVDRKRAGEQRVPELVVSATLRMPMADTAAAAVTLMRGATRTGLRPGILHADFGYFASTQVDKLHRPAYELGFTPLTDYRRERLGINGGGPGARWVEGQAYCSQMPNLLVSATLDFREGTIGKRSYRLRLEAREQYRMRAAGKPTKSGTIRMVCSADRHFDKPATPNGADALSRPSSDAPREACTRSPVSLSWDDALRNRQAFAYGSAKWMDFYNISNRAGENLNVRLSQYAHRAPSGVLGFAAAQVSLTMNLTTYNLHMIAKSTTHKTG